MNLWTWYQNWKSVRRLEVCKISCCLGYMSILDSVILLFYKKGKKIRWPLNSLFSSQGRITPFSAFKARVVFSGKGSGAGFSVTGASEHQPRAVSKWAHHAYQLVLLKGRKHLFSAVKCCLHFLNSAELNCVSLKYHFFSKSVSWKFMRRVWPLFLFSASLKEFSDWEM